MQKGTLGELRSLRRGLIAQMTNPNFLKAVTILANQSRPEICGCGEPFQRVYGSTVKVCPNCLV